MAMVEANELIGFFKRYRSLNQRHAHLLKRIQPHLVTGGAGEWLDHQRGAGSPIRNFPALLVRRLPRLSGYSAPGAFIFDAERDVCSCMVR
jgi:hypothetical protein